MWFNFPLFDSPAIKPNYAVIYPAAVTQGKHKICESKCLVI